MMRQWDIKKEFKPDYRWVAGIVFFGWLRAIKEGSWSQICSDAWDVAARLSLDLLGVVLGIVLLLTSPVSFPVFCLIHRQTRRKERLRYIRRNRKADADI